MVDYGALETLLTNDLTYDGAVVAGNNTLCVILLNAPSGALPRRWRPILVSDFLDAIASETLTTAQANQITTYTTNITHVPVHKSSVRSWIQSQGWAQSTIDALKAYSEVPGKPCDTVLGDEDNTVTLNDVRRVVRLIAKSPY